MREDALRNEVSMLNAARRDGKEDGVKKGKKDTACNLVSMGVLSIEQISKATGLGMDEVRRLQSAKQAGAS